jgi:hypothetical protein
MLNKREGESTSEFYDRVQPSLYASSLGGLTCIDRWTQTVVVNLSKAELTNSQRRTKREQIESLFEGCKILFMD